jgi:hypothetical protein
MYQILRSTDISVCEALTQLRRCVVLGQEKYIEFKTMCCRTLETQTEMSVLREDC